MMALSGLVVAVILAQSDAPVSAEAAVWRTRLSTHLKAEHQDYRASVLFLTPAARVNDETILLSTVLLRYASYLDRAETSLTENEYAQLVHKIVARDLPAHIDRTLLAQAAMRDLSPEQQTYALNQLERDWQEHRLPELAREMLPRDGTPVVSLPLSHAMMEELKRNFIRERLSIHYLYSKVPPDRARDAKENKRAHERFMTQLREDAEIRTAYLLAK